MTWDIISRHRKREPAFRACERAAEADTLLRFLMTH